MSESTHFLILIDEDRRQFTIEGPLCDAHPWRRAVDKARKTGAKSNVVTLDRRRVPKRSQNGNGTTDTSTAWLNRDVSCRLSLNAAAKHALTGDGDSEGQPRRAIRNLHRRRPAHVSRPPGHRASDRAFPEVQESAQRGQAQGLADREETVVAFRTGSD